MMLIEFGELCKIILSAKVFHDGKIGNDMPAPTHNAHVYPQERAEILFFYLILLLPYIFDIGRYVVCLIIIDN